MANAGALCLLAAVVDLSPCRSTRHRRFLAVITSYSIHYTKLYDENEVLQLIGPPVPHWTIYYEARDELVWEWRYCDDWNEPARFNVMFDGTTRRVRFTYAAPEHLRGLSGFGDFRGWCGH